MSAEQNAALVRRYFEECVSGASGPHQARALAMVAELLTDDFVMFYNAETVRRFLDFKSLHRQTRPPAGPD